MRSNLKRFGVAAALMAAPHMVINALTVTGHGPWRTQGIEVLGLLFFLGNWAYLHE